MAGNDSYTKLLLHCDGPDGSTSFTDASASAHTVTAYGDAQVDTAQSKFGGASGLFDGTGDYLSIPDSADFDFGTAPWTIDFWCRPTGTQNYGGLISATIQFGSGWAIIFDANTTKVQVTLDSTPRLTATTALTNDVWTHVAVVKDASSLNIYLGGTLDASASNTEAWNGSNGGDTIIGRFFSNTNNYYFSGWLDELRVSKGIARWTSAFTPPTEAYSVSSAVLEHLRARRAYPINRVPPHAIVW